MSDEDTNTETSTTEINDEEEIPSTEENPTYSEVGDDSSDLDEDIIQDTEEEIEEYEYSDEDTFDDTLLDYAPSTNDEDYENTVEEESGTTQELIETISESTVTSDTFQDTSTTQTSVDEVIQDTTDYTNNSDTSDTTIIDNEIETTTTIDEVYDETDETDLSEYTDDVIQELEVLEDNDSIDETLTDNENIVTVTTEADTLYDVIEDTVESIDENYEEYTEDSPIIVLSDEIDNVTTEEVVTPDLDSTLELTTQATINDDGTITTDIDTSKLDVGEHVVQILYPGDAENEASVGTATITVVEPTLTDTKIAFTGLNAEQTINDTITYTITLSDINDNNISNATVSINGTDGTSITGTTDEKGVLAGTFNLTSVGEKTYTITYEGNDSYNKSSTEVTTNIEKERANISCNIQTTKIDPDTDIYYNIYVWNETKDKSLNGGTITIYVDGVATDTIENSGSEITKSFNLPQGVHELYVTLTETDTIYQSSSEIYKLYVGINDILSLATYDYDTIGSMLSEMKTGQVGVLAFLTRIDDTTYIENQSVNIYRDHHSDFTKTNDNLQGTLNTSIPLDEDDITSNEAVRKRNWLFIDLNDTMYSLDTYISASYKGNDTLTATESDEYIIPHGKTDVPLQITPSSDVITSDTDMTYYISLMRGKRPVVSDTVHVYIDNEFYQDITTLSNSSARTITSNNQRSTVSCNGSIIFPLSQGDHTVYAIYDGNEYYNAVNSNILTIKSRKQCNLTLSIPKTSIELNELITFTLNLTDKDNTGIPDEQVQIAIGDTIIQGVTDTNGTWTYEYTPTIVGTYTIKGYHVLSDEYSTATTDSTDINVTDHVLYITATPTSNVQYLNNTQEYLIRTVDSANNSIPNVTIESKLIIPPDSTEQVDTITTDDNGEATVTCACETVGMYHLQLSFKGDDNYLATEVEDINFTVNKRPTSITDITFTPDTLKVGETSTITAVLNDTDKQLKLGNKELTFTFSNGTITDTVTAVTNNEGLATTTYKINNYGNYTVTVQYAGDDIYATCSNTKDGLQYNNLSVSVNGYITDVDGNRTDSIQFGDNVIVTGSVLSEDNTCPSVLTLILTDPEGTKHVRTAPISKSNKNYNVTFSNAQYITMKGAYSIELYTESQDTYAESNHVTVHFTVNDEDIKYYDASTWTGNPVIQQDDKIIRLNGVNMAYMNVSMDKINNINFTMYHNGADGRKNIGFYNPTTEKWIGYITAVEGGGQQGVNQATDYSSTVDMTSLDVRMMDEQETQVDITVTTTDVIIKYDSMNDTQNTVTIPLDDIDKTGYYFAVQDYKGLGMYLKDIVINEGGGEYTMNSELILHNNGQDTNNWKTTGNSTVPVQQITNTTAITTTTDNGQWNNTYLDYTIPLTGHYTLNTEIYHTERQNGYWSIEFLKSPLTKMDENAYDFEVCYTHETEEWEDNSNQTIIQSSDLIKIPMDTWTLLSFDINNGKLTVTYNNQILNLGTLTSPVYFSMRTWFHDGNIACGNIELRKYRE